MKNLLFGYVRVSTREQNEGRQLQEMKKAGVDERNVYVDKSSGKDFERSAYKALIDRLREGDTLIICSIDRLGRNYTEIMEQWRYITQTAKANVKVLDMPLLDTTANTQTLDNRFIADLVLQILSYVSEKERNSIKKRQAEGIALAKSQGKHLGRPKVEYPENWQQVYLQWICKKITAVEAMRILGLKNNTFYKFVAEERREQENLGRDSSVDDEIEVTTKINGVLVF